MEVDQQQICFTVATSATAGGLDDHSLETSG